MKRSVILGLVAVLLVSALACGSFLPGRRSSASEVDITIANRSPDDVCYVLISSTTDDSWGLDRLGESEVIAPGASRVFNLENGTYDLQLETCNEEVMATNWEVDRDLTVNVGERGASVRLVLFNDSSSDICVVLISSTSAEEWGSDWLGAKEYVRPGGARIFYVPPDFYDLQARDCDDNVVIEELDVDLTQDLQWTLEN
jgi:hypothetical protein